MKTTAGERVVPYLYLVIDNAWTCNDIELLSPMKKRSNNYASTHQIMGEPELHAGYANYVSHASTLCPNSASAWHAAPVH